MNDSNARKLQTVHDMGKKCGQMMNDHIHKGKRRTYTTQCTVQNATKNAGNASVHNRRRMNTCHNEVSSPSISHRCENYFLYRVTRLVEPD
jgi:hypothetical protein